MKVKCSDCKHYNFQLICFMENCMWNPAGYCASCPCNHCDRDCLEAESEKEDYERPKFVLKDVE